MKITILDGSNYFKGLLLLIRIDRIITKSEIELMKRIGKKLGFEKEFCKNTINEVLENKFMLDIPAEFSSKELAMKFIKDGLTLSLSDDEVHPAEEEWLRLYAEKNNIDSQWFYTEREKAANRNSFPDHLEVDDLLI